MISPTQNTRAVITEEASEVWNIENLQRGKCIRNQVLGEKKYYTNIGETFNSRNAQPKFPDISYEKVNRGMKVPLQQGGISFKQGKESTIFNLHSSLAISQLARTINLEGDHLKNVRELIQDAYGGTKKMYDVQDGYEDLLGQYVRKHGISNSQHQIDTYNQIMAATQKLTLPSKGHAR